MLVVSVFRIRRFGPGRGLKAAILLTATHVEFPITNNRTVEVSTQGIPTHSVEYGPTS